MEAILFGNDLKRPNNILTANWPCIKCRMVLLYGQHRSESNKESE